MTELIDAAIEEMENITEDEISEEVEGFLEVLKVNDHKSLLNERMYDVLPKGIEAQLRQIIRLGDVKSVAKYLKIVKIFAKRSLGNISCLWPVSVISSFLNLKTGFLSK